MQIQCQFFNESWCLGLLTGDCHALQAWKRPWEWCTNEKVQRTRIRVIRMLWGKIRRSQLFFLWVWWMKFSLLLLLFCFSVCGKFSNAHTLIPIDLIGGIIQQRWITLMEGTSVFEGRHTKYQCFYKKGEVHIPLSSRANIQTSQ